MLKFRRIKKILKAGLSIYDIKVKNIDGEEVSLSDYKGKPLIIVNVASKCGYANDNYDKLEKIYEEHKKDGLEILAFPSNQFLKQEPLPNNEIKEYCQLKKITFPVFEKIDVNGKNQHELYKFLKGKKRGFLFKSIKWNFTKFFINQEGEVVARIAPNQSWDKVYEAIDNILVDQDDKDSGDI